MPTQPDRETYYYLVRSVSQPKHVRTHTRRTSLIEAHNDIRRKAFCFVLLHVDGVDRTEVLAQQTVLEALIDFAASTPERLLRQTTRTRDNRSLRQCFRARSRCNHIRQINITRSDRALCIVPQSLDCLCLFFR